MNPTAGCRGRLDVGISLVVDDADAAWPASIGRRGHLSSFGRDPADEQLVGRIAVGDDGALGELYDKWSRPAYSLARRVSGDDGLAQEVLQEVFLTLWRSPRGFDPHRGAFGTWLMTLVHHKAVDTVRREATVRRNTVPAFDPADESQEPPGAGGPAADEAALGLVVAGKVRDALRTLPAEQRQALGLAYYGGYTQREVSALTGVPLGTVKSRMFAALARLRRLLGPVVDGVSAESPS